MTAARMIAFVLCVCIVIVTLSYFTHAQEAPAYKMKMWQLGWIPPNDNQHETFHKVTVISTEGVCLYIVTGARREVEPNSADDSLALSQAAAIAVVPKTQLPHGVGCQ